MQSRSLLCCKPDCTVKTAASLAGRRIQGQQLYCNKLCITVELMSCILPISPPQLPFIVHVRSLSLGTFFLSSILLLRPVCPLSAARIPVASCLQLADQEQGLCCVSTGVNLTSEKIPELEHNGQWKYHQWELVYFIDLFGFWWKKTVWKSYVLSVFQTVKVTVQNKWHMNHGDSSAIKGTMVP